ncbi:MAG: GNAT family N-acetyltransferase [Chloroflexi bacterium]|nr:GNAT family N-acetyltransferase [Chloroflexota bacterium]
MMKIREFNGEFEATAEIMSISRPEYKQTAEQTRGYYERRNPDFITEWYVVEERNSIVGVVYISQPQYQFHPEKYLFSIHLHPELENPAHREDIYHFILKRLAPLNPLALQSKVLSSQTFAVDFLTRHGFVEIMRELNSELALDDFDTTPFADLISRLEDEGIHITTLAQLKESDPDWRQKLFDLDWILSIDVPTPESPVRPTLEQYFKQHVHRPDVSLDLWHIAVHDGRWIGMTNLVLDMAEDDIIHNDLTGVLRDYRRRGIATALKVVALKAAQQLGRRVVKTSNEENNPMYQININLGFKPTPGWVEYEKRLR